MRRIIWLLLMLLSSAYACYSIGLMYGPLADEEYLIENDGLFPITHYGFPVFLGGIYHRAYLNNSIFYHVDLSFGLHNTETGDISMQNHLLYLHNDINAYLIKRMVYMGLGMEVIGIYTQFSPAFKEQDDNLESHYFCYLNGGINIPMGSVEVGLKLLYRLLPFSSAVSGKGEISLLFGIGPLTNKKANTK